MRQPQGRDWGQGTIKCKIREKNLGTNLFNVPNMLEICFDLLRK